MLTLLRAVIQNLHGNFSREEHLLAYESKASFCLFLDKYGIIITTSRDKLTIIFKMNNTSDGIEGESFKENLEDDFEEVELILFYVFYFCTPFTISNFDFTS